MRKNVSIGKRFASGVSPSPRVEQKSCTVDGWPKRIIIVVSLGYRIFLFHSRVTHPLFPLSFAVKLHFKHVYRFFFAHTWRIPRWNNIFQRWHAWCSPVNYRFPFFLGRNRATFRSFVSHFLFRIVNERCMRNLRPRSIFDLDISVINIRTAISLPVEWRKNDENREEYEKLLVRKFVCRNIEDRCWLYFCNDDGGFQWRRTFENVLKRLSWFFSRTTRMGFAYLFKHLCRGACEKARDDKEDGIDGYWSIYIGKYRCQDIVTYDKRLMDVFLCIYVPVVFRKRLFHRIERIRAFLRFLF